MLKHVLTKIRGIVKDIQHDQPHELATVAENIYGELLNLINYIHKALVDIENDTEFDAKSKSNARRLLFEEAERKLEVLKDKKKYVFRLKPLETESASLAPPNDDTIIKFMQEKEIRDRLVGMTERQIKSHFGESLFDGSNPLLIDAILNAPPGFELLAEEDLKRLRAVSARKKAPQMTTETEFISRFNASILHMFGLVKNELDALRQKELPAALVGKKQKS
jgi:hypothetical protein